MRRKIGPVNIPFILGLLFLGLGVWMLLPSSTLPAGSPIGKIPVSSSGSVPSSPPPPQCLYGGTYPNCNPPPISNTTTTIQCLYGGTYPNCVPGGQSSYSCFSAPGCAPPPPGLGCYGNSTTAPVNYPVPGSGIPQSVATASVGTTLPGKGSGYCAIAQYDPSFKIWDIASGWWPSLAGANIYATGFAVSGWYTIIVNDANHIIQSYGTPPSGFTPGSIFPSTIGGIQFSWVLVGLGAALIILSGTGTPKPLKGV